jgi:hypothetical protein
MTYTLFFFLNRNLIIGPIDEVHAMKRFRDNGKTRNSFRVCQDIINLSRNLIMNRKYISTLTLALASLAAGNALAADAAAPKTHEQVRAELIEAQRTGDIAAHGETFKTRNELYPNQYPEKAVTQGNTRAQVLAELAEAKSSGEFVSGYNYGSH